LTFRSRDKRSDILLIEALSPQICIFGNAECGDEEPFDISLF
jgi:hypothetical protein